MSPLFFKVNTKKHNFSNHQRVFRELNLRYKIPIFVIILFIFLLGFYLWQTNDIIIKGFEIKKLGNRIEEFKQENKIIELKVTNLQALSNIEELKEALNMVEITQVKYISSVNPVAAK